MGSRVSIEKAYYRYPGSPWVINGVDLNIRPGENLFVCGVNGSGKSTLGHLLNGLAPHFFGGTLKGRIMVGGADTRKASVSELFSQVGLVMQNTDAQLFNSTVEQELAFALESLGLGGAEIDSRIEQISDQLEIEHLLTRAPETLSAGEKRRVAIGSILCMRPPVLVLDEPFANLDWSGCRKLAALLKKIHTRDQTIVVIEQRAEDSFSICDRCVVLHSGKVCFSGAPSPTAMDALEKYELIPRFPQRKKRTVPKGEPMLRVEALSCHLGGRAVLKDVSLAVYPGEIVAIVGKNGSGKTTLIKHFNGLIRPPKGRVRFMGEDVHSRSPVELASRIGLSFQNPNHQFFKSTVEGEIVEAKRVNAMNWDLRLEKIKSVFRLDPLLARSPFKLSEGEKKRVAISSILAMGSKLVVLDEPTAGQDGRFRKALAETLLEVNREGVAIVIVTHDLAFAKAVADRWIVLVEGTVVSSAKPAGFDDPENQLDSRSGFLAEPGKMTPFRFRDERSVRGFKRVP